MSAPDPRRYAETPPSEVEWEDLLLRVDIGARAVRVALEDATDPHAAAAPLRDAIAEEAFLQGMLEAMAEGREPDAGDANAASEAGDDAATLARRFATLRARSFAMVQRRGLGVWGWRLSGGPWPGATAYQLLQAAAARDGRTLAAVRGAR
jgi:hypothetical protein